jgi:hypothetical protein
MSDDPLRRRRGGRLQQTVFLQEIIQAAADVGLERAWRQSC